MRGFSGDVTLAARRLLATPLFTIFAVLSLAVGVGVTTAVYSVVDAIFLKEPGISDPDRLLFVVTPYDGRVLKGSISEPDFLDLRSAQTSFSSVSASALFSPAVTSPSMTELLTAEAVDGAYFSTVGVPAALGRTIRPSDAVERVVVLSHGLWRARFGADPTIVGRTVRISGRPFEVIGIAPASFEGASGGVPGTKLWIPLGTEPSTMFPSSTRSARSPTTAGLRTPGAVGHDGGGISGAPRDRDPARHDVPTEGTRQSGGPDRASMESEIDCGHYRGRQHPASLRADARGPRGAGARRRVHQPREPRAGPGDHEATGVRDSACARRVTLAPRPGAVRPKA